MKHKSLQKLLSTVLIILGVVLIAFPKSYELYREYRQQKLLKSWEESFQLIGTDTDEEEEYAEQEEEQKDEQQQQEQNDDVRNITDTNVKEKSSSANSEKLLEVKKMIESSDNMEGIIKIDKIDLELPILNGAIQANLNISVASIANTGEAGEYGNYSIAGHRSRTYGRNFNRLDEVEIGDQIDINTGSNIYHYTVTEKLYVDPDDVWVLESDKEVKEITLVTCHPLVEPTQRLIIKGTLEES